MENAITTKLNKLATCPPFFGLITYMSSKFIFIPCVLCIGLDEMLVARWLARFMDSSARLGSARLNFFYELS
jgi:hypothetical protein